MNRSSARSRVAVQALTLAAVGMALAACGPKTSTSVGGNPGGGSGNSTTPAAHNSSTPAQGSGSVGTPLFPIAVGDTWTNIAILGGTQHGTSTNKVISVAPIPGGHRVTLQVSSTITGVPATTTSLVYIFHSDGSITVPFQQVGSTGVSVKSGSIIWPSQSQLASGQTTTSKLVVQIHSSALSTTVTANIAVKGLGTQTVTVPAGTYSATVVNETISEKVEGISVSTVVKTWLAPGVGPVKSEVFSSTLGASKAIAVDELKSFTKG
jgi:hypothetical protein